MKKISKFIYAALPLLLAGIVLISSCKQKGNDAKNYVSADSVKIMPSWTKDANIYEVNIRQYTPEGTFKAFENHLPRLKEIGVDILWLMPVFPVSEKNRKGSLGSYYAVADYKKVNPEFGTLDDLKSVINKAHELGMYVILDWVANHTGWDNPWITQNPDWYTKDSTGAITHTVGTDWTDVADLNYDNMEMRTAMIDALKYWVTETNIDGYRCDVAGMVPMEFWVDARKQLNTIKPVFMLAEDESAEMHKAFDMTYAWSMHHMLNKIAKGEYNAKKLDSLLQNEAVKYKPEDYRMQFITNHDENSWSGTEFERMGDAVNTMAVLTYTLPGMPLIYSGQEAAFNQRLKFFEKDTIEWGNYKMAEFYTKLSNLKTQNNALWNGPYGGKFESVACGSDNAYAFVRSSTDNTVFCVINISKQPVTLKLDVKNLNGKYSEYFSQTDTDLKDELSLELKPWEYKVYVKK